MVNDCIFCQIVRGEIDSKKIYETENVISFLDANPRAPGHSLVIPKKHVKILQNLEDDIIAETFQMVKKVENDLKKALNPDAFTVGINDGEAAGQEIPHLHINIIPRYQDDGGGPIHSVVSNQPEQSVSEIADKIQNSNRK